MKKITAIIEDEHLSTILSALAQADIKDLRVETHGEEKRKVHRGDKSTYQTIMGHFTPEGYFYKGTCEGWLMKEGFNKSSASPALNRLIKAGFIEKRPDGTYRFVKEWDIAEFKESN